MEDYLIDRETLEKFVDELMKKHPLPVDNAEELSDYKEKQIKALDDHIAKALFGSLTESQATELEQLLDNDQESPDAFREFFHHHHIDLEKIIAEAARSFGAKHSEGGQNA